MTNTRYRPLDYSDSYFTVDYKAQYGKTYFEDFDNIYRISGLRIDKIMRYLRTQNIRGDDFRKLKLSILDIGSAAGFFLKCASDRGFARVEGIEISPFAAGRSKERFGFPVTVFPFSGAEINGKFDVISAWYFIEHSDDPLRDIKKIYAALNAGGIFALSAPSIFGPLYYLNRDEWLSSHPADHLIDMTPASARRLLKKIGFKKIKIYPAGIHPDRVISRTSPLFGVFSSVYNMFSRVTAFSDTIEIYAVK